MHGIRFILALVIILKTIFANGTSPEAVKFPNIELFLGSKVPDLKQIYEIHECKVQILSGSCAFRVIPQRAHCLTLAKVIDNILPSYILTLSVDQIKDILPISITVFYINTCLGKVTFVTSADGQLRILPVLKVKSMVADISVPIPFGDYEMIARGTWWVEDNQMSVKITRSSTGEMTLSGTARRGISIKAIAKKFDVDILPSGGINVLLRNIGLDNFRLRRVKVRGQIRAIDGDYEMVFSGVPDIASFEEAHIRILVVKRGKYRNLALLLELPDYSPVTLLRKMFGPTVNRITLLRDRNQTLALFVTSKIMADFSQVLTAHGSSRWIHRHSKFSEGATLLVTLPFPKRKALDMKIQLFPDGLGFALPDGENLPGDLALTAISPEHIIRLDRIEKTKSDSLSSEQLADKFRKILILKFRYFLLNDTYLAAAEQLNAMEEELKEMMPVPITLPKNDAISIEEKSAKVEQKDDSNKLELFFKRNERLSEKPVAKLKSDVVKKQDDIKTHLAEKLGLLRKRRVV